jgi:phenylalanyl-tRNA synthetase beta chain
MPRAIARFAELLRHSCPELVVHDGMVDEITEHLPKPVSVTVRRSEVTRKLGVELDSTSIAKLLSPIGFDVLEVGESLSAAVPSWRLDCTTEIDVIEEIGRQFGFSKLGKRVPSSTTHGRLSPLQRRRRQLRELLLGLGLSEAMPNPFLADDDLRRAGLDGHSVVRLVNSLVADESVLRTSLRPGLLKAVAFNGSHRRFDARLFEIGHVYPPSDDTLPAEHEALGVVLAGQEAPAAVAIWREVVATMGIGARVDQQQVPPGLHPTRSATLSLGRDTVGAVGEVHPDVLDAYGINERVAVLELHLTRLLGVEPKPAQWKPVSRFPSSDMDLAFVVADSVPAEKVLKAIRQGAGNLAVDVALFDVYRGAGVPDGHRSLATRVRCQADDRTLTDADLVAVRERILAAVTKLGGTLRG